MEDRLSGATIAAASNVDEMLAVAASRADELAAPGLSPQPRRRVAVLTCMDTRIDLFPMLGLQRGDAHIIRNAGGLVTDDAIRSLSASQTTIADAESRTTGFTYSGTHISQMTDSAGRVYKYFYTGALLTKYTDPENHDTLFDYDTSNRMQLITTPAGHKTKITYYTSGANNGRVHRLSARPIQLRHSRR